MTAHIPTLPGIPYKQSSVYLHPPQDTLRKAATTLEGLIVSLRLTRDGKAFLASPPQTALQEHVQQRLQELEMVNQNIAEAMEKLIEAVEILQKPSSSKLPVQAKSGAKHYA